MNCNVIRDLLPLYMDDCCSEESRKLVEDHLEHCAQCREEYECMCAFGGGQPMEMPVMNLQRVSNWKASLLQTVILFVSFAILAVSVILEGNTPAGETNGLWAIALMIPAMGALLSLANWFFLRVYKNRKQFSGGSCLVTLGLIVLGYGWAAVHYADGIDLNSPLVLVGAGLSVLFVILSKILSNQYALYLGRE